jgi:starch-binding outer membrane protein, SusD/RagB family
MHTTQPRRRTLLLLLGAMLTGAVGCNDFLRAENPGAIEQEDVGNPAYTTLLVNGVIGEFQPAFTSVALHSAVLTDELSNWHGFVDYIEIDRRAITYQTGTYSGAVYIPLHMTRFAADTTAVLLQKFLGAAAQSDTRLARVYAYGGYAYTLLAEQMCASPISRSRAYTPDELFGFALDRFTSTITVAQAARNSAAAITPATTASTAEVARADSLINLARVGSARALLNLNRKTEAAAMAALVPAGFEFRVYHSANSARETNPFYGAGSGGPNAQWIGVTYTPFETISDPRAPHSAAPEKMQQDQALAPHSPLAFSTYSGTVNGADFTQAASVRFASGLEAQYIVAEAQGNTGTNVAFVNGRRSIGGLAPLVAPTDAQYFAALREQRMIDLWLAGYRLGDLRRYKRYQGVDLYPSGAYRGPSNLALPPEFGNVECWPIPLSEYNGNPNLPKP